MGSNADFMENSLKPEEYAYPSDSSKIKIRHEIFITPTKSHGNKTPSMFFHPASIGDAPRAPRTPQNLQTIEIYKILGPGCFPIYSLNQWWFNLFEKKFLVDSMITLSNKLNIKNKLDFSEQFSNILINNTKIFIFKKNN